MSDTTEVTLVDCDSMQFTDRSGRRFLCGVGRPEFTAPELVGADLRSHPREKASDLFALAAHIHQLLMAGNHPFLRGIWIGSGDHPDVLTLAKSGQWAGGPGSGLGIHPLAPPLSLLPAKIQHLFERAFTEGARDPSSRPTAWEWRDALLSIRIESCPGGSHQVPKGTAPCPWCVIDDERETRRLRRQSKDAIGLRPQALSHRHAVTAKPGLENSYKLIIWSLVAFTVVVISLTVFIVWGILSGASPLGL